MNMGDSKSRANFIYDVFLSYHGGQSNSVNSSYQKAEELKSYLNDKGLSVFLCKDTASSDFYDAINQGILQSKHFILVACDKNMLSKWVYDEIKQFDSLRKNGEKPNGMIGAYIFGDLQPSDLYKFNSVFSSIDIKFGEDGFASLYEQISALDGVYARTMITQHALSSVRYIDMTNLEVGRKIVSCINRLEQSERDYWTSYAMELFGFYNVLSIFDYIRLLSESTNVLVIRLYRHYILNFMVKASEIKPIGDLEYLILVADDNSGGKDVIIDLRNRRFLVNDEDTTLQYENGVIRISANQSQSSKNRVVISSGEHGYDQMLTPPQEGDEDIPTLLVRIDHNDIRSECVYVDVQKSDFLSFIVHSIVNKLIGEQWIDKDTAKYFDYIFTESYDKNRVLMQFDQLYKKLIATENSIITQYSAFKRTGTFASGQNNINENHRYAAVIEKIKGFYLNKDAHSLIDAISLLEMERKVELQRGSHYKQQAILLIISELVMNNMYSYENDQSVLNCLVKDLQASRSREVIPDYGNQLYTMMLSIQKEMIFSGMYESVSISMQSALSIILSNMTKHINLLKELADNREVVVSQLFLLYRQRAVIWEHLGDASSDYVKRMDCYRSWRDDTLAAINFGKSYESDKEILGCAYLNYASALNRLTVTIDTDDGKKKSYAECLENLNVAYRILRGNCARRYIGYVHLHRADCYSEMYESGLYDNTEVVRQMDLSSRKALDIFNETQDLLGRGWALRILVKAIIRTEGKDLKVRLVDGLNKLKAALVVNTQASVVKEISHCVKDFSEYLRMIEVNKLSDEMEGLIKQIFSAELKAFVMVVRDVDLDHSDIFSVQGALRLIMDKLQE